MQRRDFLIRAPLAAAVVGTPMAAMAHNAAKGAPVAMTRESLIAHHKAELFRLMAETAPEGTVVSHVTVLLFPDRAGTDIISARDIGRKDGNYPFYQADGIGRWRLYSGYGDGIPVAGRA